MSLEYPDYWEKSIHSCDGVNEAVITSYVVPEKTYKQIVDSVRQEKKKLVIVKVIWILYIIPSQLVFSMISAV